MRRLYLVMAFAVGCIGLSRAGERADGIPNSEIPQDTVRVSERQAEGIYRYPSRTLTPMGTGRSVSFQLDMTPSVRYAVKTNLLYWASLSPNLGFETALGPHTSVELSDGFHPWNKKNRLTKPRKYSPPTSKNGFGIGASGESSAIGWRRRSGDIFSE